MLKLTSVVASLGVAKALTQAQIDNECYDFWNRLEESGVGEFDELNVGVGANINAGALTSVGTGAGINGGRLHIAHVAGNNDPTIPIPVGGQGGARSLNTGVGANVGLGGTSTAVDLGVGFTDVNGLSNIDLYRGNLNNIHTPGFQHMNNGIGNEQMGLGGMIHRQGTGYTVGNVGFQSQNYNNVGQVGRRLRRRLLRDQCAPPPATGGKPVTCASTGDPHIVDFKGEKFDHMAFGEFIFYNAWEPFSHHPQTSLKIQVRNGPFQGRNPQVSSNQGVAIGGALACGNKYEIHKANANEVSRMKIRRRNGQEINVTGRDKIYSALSQETCPMVKIQDNVAHFVFQEDDSGDRTTLRVQIVSYGLNLGLDVLGSLVRTDTDRGICTKNAGWDMQLECSHSMFTIYPGGSCNNLKRGGHRGGPAVECPLRLKQQADGICGRCPETVNPMGCVYDICALGDISYADEVLSACRVGVRLPARMTAQTGVNINMEGATAINVGRGSGINYGVANVRIHDAYN